MMVDDSPAIFCSFHQYVSALVNNVKDSVREHQHLSVTFVEVGSI